MWGVNPKLLCQKHLLGEHVEMHMFVGTILAGKSLDGYIKKGLVIPKKINERHDELAQEMILRGMNHQSPLDQISIKANGMIAIEKNKKELIKRCSECRNRIKNGKDKR